MKPLLVASPAEPPSGSGPCRTRPAVVRRARRSSGPHRRLGPHPFVEATVAAAFRLPPDALRRPSRGEAEIAFARQIAMYVCHVWVGLSLTEVGHCFGRDRTTVAHACRVVEERREDPRVDLVLDCIETALENWRKLSDSRPGGVA